MTIHNTKILSISFILTILTTLYFPVATIAGKVSDGSSIAGIYLENLTIEEAEEELKSNILQWQAEPPLKALNDFESLEIPREIFQFDLHTSIEQLEDKMKRHWSNFFIKQKNVQQELFVSLAPGSEKILNWPEYVDADKTLEHALTQASNLSHSPVTLVYIEGVNADQEEIATVSLELPEISESTIEYLIDNLNGQILEPHTLYSFLEENTLPNGMANSEDEMSFLGSAFYELILQTNIEIIERHSQKAIPSYTEAGLEARVNREKELDLRLYHTNNFAFTLSAVIKEETIELAIESAPNEQEYNFLKENEVEIKPRKIYRYNKDLTPGTEKVVQEGEPGLQLEIYRLSNSKNSSQANKELIARDYYAPIPKIIERAVAEEPQNSEEQIAEQTPNNEEMQIVTPAPEIDSIFNRWIPQNDERQAICEEDPRNPHCQQTDLSLLSLLHSCLIDEGLSLQPGEESNYEESTQASSSNLCNLIPYLLLLSMAENGLSDEEADYIEDGFLNEEGLEADHSDMELHTEVNEEEEVSY